ncbi:hypothetical protein JCM33374_g2224 [Metschnikowia sp. JCM 33374]|nr:hypothetical protein JCM33374_g2224 [Metschnikowia sp. JCM 33374]
MKESLVFLILFLSVVDAVPSGGPQDSEMVFPREDLLAKMTNKLQNLQIPHDTTVNSCTCELMDHQNHTRRNQNMLAWFVIQLKSFIFQTHFDSSGFALVVKRMTRNLVDIEESVRLFDAQNEAVLEHLQFAQKMFDVMKFSMKALKTYTRLGNPDQHLLNRMVQLNVRLWSLYNSQGKLDRMVHEYGSTVIESWKTMSILDDDFKGLPAVPDHIRLLFDEQRAQAEETVHDLWIQIPDDE